MQAESFRSLLREALARAEEQQRQQLRRQAEQLTAAHAGGPMHGRQAQLTQSSWPCAGGGACGLAPQSLGPLDASTPAYDGLA